MRVSGWVGSWIGGGGHGQNCTCSFLSLFPFASPCSCHLGGAAQVGAVPWVWLGSVSACCPCCPLARENDQSKLLRDAPSPLKSARFLSSEKLSAVDWLLCLPGIHMAIPNPHSDGIRRLVLWEAISCESETFMNGICTIYKRNTLPLPSREDTEKAATQKETLIWQCWHPHLGPPAPRTMKSTFLLFKPPHLWYFVTTATRNYLIQNPFLFQGK